MLSVTSRIILLFLSLSITLCHLSSLSSAQVQSYNTAPFRSYTWATNASATPDKMTNGTAFTWQTGHGGHYGLAYFAGSGTFETGDYVNLLSYPDDSGYYLPLVIGGGPMSFEAWVSFQSWQKWSRVFDFGACGGCDNIVVSQEGSLENNAPALAFHNTYGGTPSSPISALGPDGVTDCNMQDGSAKDGPLRLNMWLHIVCGYTQRSASDLSSTTAADLSCSVNGIPQILTPPSGYPTQSLATAYTTPGPFPRTVARPLSWLARSTYTSNTDNYNFNGWFDSFYIWNYSLPQEAISWHYTMPRPPFFEVVAAQDPRQINNLGTSATYNWLYNDTNDAVSVRQYHSGLLTFDGSSQYVDLSTTSGSSSVGTALTTQFGDGTTWGNGVSNLPGFSFEVVVKLSTVSASTPAKIFTVGAGAQNNEIYLQISGSTLTCNTYSSLVSTQTSAITVLSNAVANLWYHIIISVQKPAPNVGSPTAAVISTYVNGNLTSTSTGRSWLANVARTHVFLGKSEWSGDGKFAGKIDSFRIYDYALSLANAQAGYQLTVAAIPGDPAVVKGDYHQYVSGPQALYTFDNPPPTNEEDIYDTNFVYVGSYAGHSGLAFTSGEFENGSFVDMFYYPDSYGNTLTFPIGGSMTFEIWIQYLSQLGGGTGYYYGFVVAGVLGASSNNLAMTTVGTGSQLMYTVYYNGGTQHVGDRNSLFTVNTNNWQHFVLTIQQLDPTQVSSSTGSNCTIYLQGVQIHNQLCNIPQWVYRPNAYLGRSTDDSNARTRAYFDSFALYNYALAPEQVAFHYATPRVPFFELVFDKNPSTFWLQSSTTMYGWSASSGSHNGLLTLSQTSGQQYVNLSTSTGSASVGAALPTFGGSGIGLAGSSQLGFTFEIVFSATFSGSSPNMVIYDLAADVDGVDNIMLNFVPGQCVLQFNVYSGTTLIQIPFGSYCIQSGSWYHAAVSIAAAARDPTKATYSTYLNGVWLTSLNGPSPRKVARYNSFLGKALSSSSSNLATLPFTGSIDRFALFDFCANAEQVRKFFSFTSSDVSPSAIVSPPKYQSQALLLYTWDDPSSGSTSVMTDGTTFVRENGHGGHYGLSYFRGSPTSGAGDFINMSSYRDSRGNTLNDVVPQGKVSGPMTFEAWVDYASWQSWSRIVDWGNCAGCDNVIISQNGNSGNSPSLSFHSVNGGTPSSPVSTAGAGLVTDCDIGATANGPLRLSMWSHVVCSVTQRDITDSASSLAADFRCYVNGIKQPIYNTNYATPPLATSTSTPGALPNPGTRSLLLMGKSNYANNYNLNGWIDTFAWYNYALSDEAVAWHFTLPRPPVFEITFGQDPTQFYGFPTTSTYTYLANDTVNAYHQGLLQFNPSSTQYVDLTSGNGPSSVGTILSPSLIGSGREYTLLNPALGSTGFTFEILVKFNSASQSSKIFEIGQGQQAEEIVLNYIINNGVGSVTFNTYSASVTSQTSALTVISNVVTGSWYHLCLVLSPGSSMNAATTKIYVNGALTQTASGRTYLAAVSRNHAWLGKSDWSSDGYFAGQIDAFRVLDYAVLDATVTALYQLTLQGVLPTPLPTPGNPAQFNAAPQLLYTFDVSPDSNAYDAYDTTFGWNATYNGRSGVARFDGIRETGQFVDMQYFPDSLNRTFSFAIGGSLSLEAWFMYDALPGGDGSSGYAYIIEMGGVIGQNSNNIGLTNIGTSSTLMFIDFFGGTTQHVTDNGVRMVATPGTWQHYILSIQQLNPNITSGSSAANCTIFINGASAWTQLCNVPQWVLRPNVYLGKSTDDANSRLKGGIDTFAIYNYALSADQAALHYVSPRIPVFELTFAQNPAVQTLQPSTTYYSWSSSYSGRTGVLSLSASSGPGYPGTTSGQYVDLGTNSGLASIGTTLPILGAGYGLLGQQVGNSLEILFSSSSSSTTPNSILLDWGTSTGGVDEIILQFVPSSCAMRLTVYGGSDGSTGSTQTVIPCVSSNTWYHLIVVFTPSSSTSSTGTWAVYVGGSLYTTYSNQVMPRSVARTVSYIGRAPSAPSATSATLPWTGYIDSLRWYDFAASSTNVQSIRNTVCSSCTTVVPTSSTGGNMGGSSTSSNIPSSSSATNPIASSSSSSTGSGTGSNAGGGGSSLSGGAIAGIVIGIVVGVLICCFLVYLFFWTSSRRKSSKGSEHQDGHDNGTRHETLDEEASTHQSDEVEMQNVDGEVEDEATA